MDRQYYYIVASLPELVLNAEDTKAFNISQYKTFIWENIHPDDRKTLEILELPIDNRNLLRLLYHSDSVWDDGGNYSQLELKEILEFKRPLPKYLQEFMKVFERVELEKKELPDKQEMEKLLLEMFYGFTAKSKNKFIRNWFALDREVRNIMAAYAARYINVSFTEYLIGEDDITELIQKSNAQDFGVLRQRDYMPRLLQVLEKTNLLEREYQLDLFRWKEIDEMTTFDYFNIDAIAAFLLKAFMVERWLKLDKEKGIELLKELVKELKVENR